MNTAGFVFTKNFSKPFVAREFVLTGFDLEEESAIQACVCTRCGHIAERVSEETDCLIVNEHYDHQTVKYRTAQRMRSKGIDISIISFAMFRRLCPEVNKNKRAEIAELNPIPFGPGELVFENALWSALMVSNNTEQRLKTEIEGQNGYFGSPLKKTHYVLFDPKNVRQSRFYESVKKRERAGELRMLPISVYRIWTAEDPLKAFSSAGRVGKRIAAEHYLIYRAPWEKVGQLCGMLEQCAVAEREYLLEDLFALREHDAVFLLLDLLRTKAGNRKTEQYVYSLAGKYCEQALALNETETSFRWLAYMRDAFPPVLAEETQTDEFTLEPLPDEPEKDRTRMIRFMKKRS